MIVMNVVSSLDSHARFICQNPEFDPVLRRLWNLVIFPELCLPLEAGGSLF